MKIFWSSPAHVVTASLDTDKTRDGGGVQSGRRDVGVRLVDAQQHIDRRLSFVGPVFDHKDNSCISGWIILSVRGSMTFTAIKMVD